MAVYCRPDIKADEISNTSIINSTALYKSLPLTKIFHFIYCYYPQSATPDKQNQFYALLDNFSDGKEPITIIGDINIITYIIDHFL